jgi:transcriptional regulator with XRE-family HTH domain
MKLGEKILTLRKQRGLSQEEFANQITVSRQAVSKWELNETSVIA